MGAPLSLDLRSRAVEAYRSAEGTLEQLAERFHIGIATLGRWLRRLREHGDIAPALHRGGMPARIPDEQLEALLALVAEKPDRTAEELRQEWQRRTNIPLSRSAMVRALQRAGLSVKRTSFRASEQFRPDVMRRREEFFAEVSEIDPEHLIFLDESGSNIAMAPLYARAPVGQRAVGRRPLHRGKNVSLLGAIRLESVVVLRAFDGAVDADRFVKFVERDLAPRLWPGDVVVLDNLPVHKDPRVGPLLKRVGARPLFLPPYCPELNPIENFWSTFKKRLARTGARTRDALRRAIRNVRRTFRGSCEGLFKGCGYLARTPADQNGISKASTFS